MKVKIRIGIDPGKDGFISANVDGDLIFDPMPTIGKEYDLDTFDSILRAYKEVGGDIHCCVENVHAIQGGGATSNFQFGKGVGIIEALLASNKIPTTKVSPIKWQKLAWEGVTIQVKPNPKNKSGKSTDTKATSLIAAKRLYPDVDLRKSNRARVPHDGKVDSLLILHYCLMKI